MADARFSDRGDGHWSLAGELDFGSVPDLLFEVKGRVRGNGAIELDLSDVTRADSAGLALLIECMRAAARAGRSMRFINVPEQLHSIARVSGLDGILSLPGGESA